MVPREFDCVGRGFLFHTGDWELGMHVPSSSRLCSELSSFAVLLLFHQAVVFFCSIVGMQEVRTNTFMMFSISQVDWAGL